MGKKTGYICRYCGIYTLFKNNDFKIFQSSRLSDTRESGKRFPVRLMSSAIRKISSQRFSQTVRASLSA